MLMSTTSRQSSFARLIICREDRELIDRTHWQNQRRCSPGLLGFANHLKNRPSKIIGDLLLIAANADLHRTIHAKFDPPGLARYSGGCHPSFHLLHLL